MSNSRHVPTFCERYSSASSPSSPNDFPRLLQLAPQLRHPAGRHAELTGDVAGAFAGGQVVDDATIPSPTECRASSGKSIRKAACSATGVRLFSTSCSRHPPNADHAASRCA